MCAQNVSKYIVIACVYSYFSPLNIIYYGYYRQGCYWNGQSWANGNYFADNFISDYAWVLLLLLVKFSVAVAAKNVKV